MIKSSNIALPANHEEVQQNCATTIVGKINFFRDDKIELIVLKNCNILFLKITTSQVKMEYCYTQIF